MRNYIVVYMARLDQGPIGSNVYSVCKSTLQLAEIEIVRAQGFGFTLTWGPQIGYFLMNKTNCLGLLDSWATRYQQALHDHWSFFQQGGFWPNQAEDSPRKVWSHGE